MYFCYSGTKYLSGNFNNFFFLFFTSYSICNLNLTKLNKYVFIDRSSSTVRGKYRTSDLRVASLLAVTYSL